MPLFIIEREMPGASRLSMSELRALSLKSLAVRKDLDHKIQWLHSYVTDDKLYCLYIAPDEAMVREHANRVGVPANRIEEVQQLIDPASAE